MSIHHKAILVDLTLSSLATTRIDQSVTAEVLRRKSAAEGAGSWVSRLWPKAALEPISSHDSATGRIHREMTLPWLDNSKRILPTARFEEYMAIMRTRRPEREAIIRDHFLSKYQHWVQAARDMRKDLFDPPQNPPLADVTARFSFRVEAEPVPHRDDFRVTMSANDLSEMQSILDERLATAATAARNELLARIADPLVRIVERLSDPDAKFQNSLLTNLTKIADSIPAFNITEDPAIEAIRLRIATGLAKLNPESIRSSRSDRSRAATEANNILASIAPWMEALPTAA
jgi:hypothetical protein